MAAIRRDTFNESLRIVKTLFQTGRVVQETELNEAEDNERVSGYRAARVAIENGTNGPISFAGGVNTFTLGAVGLIIDGYSIDYAGGAPVTVLTTPGADRADAVYFEIDEVEIADPLPDPTLGEQSRRRQLRVQVKVAEGAAVPASTGHPYANGVYRYPIMTLNRLSGVASLAAVVPVPLYLLLPGPAMAEITVSTGGLVDRLVAGANNIVEGASGSLQFKDTVTTALAATPYVPVSDVFDTKGGRQLVGRAGVASASGSILRSLNGRSFYSVGDGVNSIGDYNGAAGLKDLCTAYWAAFPGKALVVVVKRGTYAPTAAISLRGPLTVIGEGKNTGGTAISPTGFVGPYIDNAGSGANRWPLTLERLKLTALATEPLAVLLGSDAGTGIADEGGNLTISHCHITGGCRVLDGAANETNILAEHSTLVPTATGADDVLSVGTASNDATTITIGNVLVRNCLSDASGGDAVPFSVLALYSTGLLYVGDVLYEGGKLITTEYITNTPPAPVRGIFKIKDIATSSAIVRSLRYVDCAIENSGATYGGPWWDYSPGLQDGSYSDYTLSAIEDLAFIRTRFVAAADNTLCPFFHMRARDYGVLYSTASMGTRVRFEKVTFEMNGKTCSQHPYEISLAVSVRAAIHVEAQGVDADDVRVVSMNSAPWIGSVATPSTSANSLVVFTATEKYGTESTGDSGRISVRKWSWLDVTNDSSGGKTLSSSLHYCESGAGGTGHADIHVDGYSLELVDQTAKNLAADTTWLSVVGSSESVVSVRNVRMEGTNKDRSVHAEGGVVLVENVRSKNMNGSSAALATVTALGLKSCHVNNVVCDTVSASTGAGIAATGGSAGVGTCVFTACWAKGFGSVGARYGGGHVSFTGCRFVANNGGLSTSAQVADAGAADSVAVFGNSCETGAGALAKFGVPSTAYGSDTTALGTHTATAAMLFNRANF